MTIEFRCEHCEKILKTSDDKAGRKASCPQCGEPIDVPMPLDLGSESIIDVFDDFDDDLDQKIPIQEEQGFLAEKSIRCQMCGEMNPARALVCSACGEVLLKPKPPRDGIRSQTIQVGDVFSRSWQLYKQNLAMCLVAPFLANLLATIAVGLIIGFAMLLYLALLLVFQDNPLVHIGIVVVLCLFMIPLVVIAVSYFELGKQSLLLKISLGEQPGVSELFSGRPFLGRMILCSLLFELIVGFGNAIFILIGFFLTLLFWPYPFLLIDQNLPGADAFVKSTKITSGNLISVALIVINIICSMILIPAAYLGLGYILIEYAGVPLFPIMGTGIFLGIVFSVFIYTFQLLVKAVTYAEITRVT